MMCTQRTTRQRAERRGLRTEARRGFTLIELILVMALLTMVISLTAPGSRGSSTAGRSTRRRAGCWR